MASWQCEKCGRVFETADEFPVCPACQTPVAPAAPPPVVHDPQRQRELYDEAQALRQSAASFGEWETAAKLFARLDGYRDANALAAQCREQAERARCEGVYQQAQTLRGGSAESLRGKAALLESIAGYRDADALAADYRRQARELETQAQQSEQARAERRQAQSAETQAVAHRRRRIIIGCAAGGAVVIAAVLCVSLWWLPHHRYQAAVESYNSGDYQTASEQFAAIATYRDSADFLQRACYQLGVAAMDSRDYFAAADYLDRAGTVEDAPARREQVRAVLYEQGMTAWRAGRFADAQESFDAAGGYEDAKAYKQLCRAVRVWRGENPPDANKMSVEKAGDALLAEMSGLWRGEEGQDVTIRTADLTVADNTLQYQANGVTYEARLLSDTSMSLIGDGDLAGNYEQV